MRNIKALMPAGPRHRCSGLAAAVYAARWVAQRGNIASTRSWWPRSTSSWAAGSNPQMLTTVDWPSGSLPPGAFTDVKALQDRVVKVGVLRGDAIARTQARAGRHAAAASRP